MRVTRVLLLTLVLALGLGLAAVSLAAASPPFQSGDEPVGSAEAVAEKAKAAEAEAAGHQARTPIAGPSSPGGGGGFELFAGLDDATVPAFRIDPPTNMFQQAFVGVEVWGAAYDYNNDQVYVSDGTDLWVWPVGAASPTFLATVSDTTGTNLSMEGLAYYDGTLYASKVGTSGEGEGLYDVDLTSFQATLAISYTNSSQTTISGIDADPATGTIYGTNDNSALRGLVQIDPDGTVTLITPYVGSESDIDGLAVGGGHAYLIADDQTPPWFEVWDFGTMTWTVPVSTPFTTTEVFAGGAWIAPFAGGNLDCGAPPVTFDSGIPATWITATTVGTVTWTTTDDVANCDNPYEVGGTPPGACADSDTNNTSGGVYDTEMWSNSFDLTGLTGASLDLRYRHRQLNNSIFTIDVSDDNGVTWSTVFSDTTGNPSGSAGDPLSVDLSSYLGSPDVRARFRYAGDGWDWYAQVDDVELTCLAPGVPDISLKKTVGTDASSCATGSNIYVTPGTDVTYCYEVTNTGSLSLTLHDLVDTELGAILSGFPFTLTPGASVFVTQTATIMTSTVNTATWTAYNPGPTDVAVATDTATVNVVSAAPFGTCVDFESGMLPPYMYPQTTSAGGANGRVQVTTAFPHTGSFALDIDTDCDGCGGSTQQAGVLVVDLGGVTAAELNFWVHEHGDENNPEDGVFISDDGGTTWAQIVNLNGFPANYENVILDLAAAASGAGMNLVDGFQIKFQSLDNFSIATDGYSFDDICVQQAQPDIAVTPPTQSSTQFPDEIVTKTMTIANTGSMSLTWSIEESDTACAGAPTDFPWLSVNPTAGATPSMGNSSVDVIFDSTGLALGTYPGSLCVNSDDPDEPTVTVPVTLTVQGAPDIAVSPNVLTSTQGPDMMVTKPFTISNNGLSDLDWSISEEPPAVANSVPVAGPAAPLAAPVVRSEEDCAAFENYAGLEPAGYAEYCTSGKVEAWTAPSFDPTDTAYALDIGFVSDNFVSHQLNDFPGQTVLGANAQPIFAMDFDSSATTLYAIDNTSRELGTLDLANGAFTPIAVVSGIPTADTISGMAIDPSTNQAYVSALGTTMSLYSFDLGTATATLIGSDATVTLLIDISISPTGVMYGHDIGTDSIYTIDRSTGTVTLVGLTGVDSNFAQGMDFDNEDGTLYAYTYQGGGANIFGTIDLATGLLTPLATSNPQGEFEGATQTAGTGAGCSPGDIPWASASPTSGTTPAGGTDMVDVTFDSTGYANGVYTGTLCVNSNDPMSPLVRLPLTMTVTGAVAPPDIVVDPASITNTQPPDVMATMPMTISNVGEADLTWMIEEDSTIPPMGPVTLPSAGGTVTIGDGVAGVALSRSGDGQAVVATPVRGNAPAGSTTITHSQDQSIVQFNSVSCNAGGLHTDNHYIRHFTLTDFGITGAFDVTEVEIGIEQAVGAGGTQPVEMRLYTWDPATPFIFANLNPIGSAAVQVPDQSLTIYTIPVMGTAPAGSTLVVDFFTPNGQTAGNSLFVGSNPNGQTAPSYLAAADCGITEPTDTTVIGFPDMHIVMNVTGNEGGGGPVACSTPVDIPWASVSPTAGTTISNTSDVVDVTFDSTGLSTGVYTGTLCVNSNDPDESLVTVPLTMTVEPPPPPMPAIVLTKTVSTDGSCGTTNAATVPWNTQVTYCYTVENTGNVTLTTHTLTDTVGVTSTVLLNGVPYDLGPGATFVYTNTEVLGPPDPPFPGTVTNCAVWEATEPTGMGAVSNTSCATVTLQTPTDVSLTGFDGDTGASSLFIWLLGLPALLAGAALLLRRRFAQ